MIDNNNTLVFLFSIYKKVTIQENKSLLLFMFIHSSLYIYTKTLKYNQCNSVHFIPWYYMCF